MMLDQFQSNINNFLITLIHIYILFIFPENLAVKMYISRRMNHKDKHGMNSTNYTTMAEKFHELCTPSSSERLSGADHRLFLLPQ